MLCRMRGGCRLRGFGLDPCDLMPESERRHHGPHRTPQAAPAPKAQEPRKPITFPADFHAGNAGEFQRLATLRNDSINGLKLATERGLLWFGTMQGEPAWILTDSTKRNGQARLLSGEVFGHIQAKAKTLPGSAAGWPIGADRVQDFPNVAICEGGPDLAAAFHFMHAESVEQVWTAVCMAGASLRIHEDALTLFNGKRCRIFAHLDTAGRQAAERWERQLTEAGAQTDVFNLEGIATDGGTAGDLNDLCNMTPDAFEDDRGLWSLFDVEGGAA